MIDCLRIRSSWDLQEPYISPGKVDSSELHHHHTQWGSSDGLAWPTSESGGNARRKSVSTYQVFALPLVFRFLVVAGVSGLAVFACSPLLVPFPFLGRLEDVSSPDPASTSIVSFSLVGLSEVVAASCRSRLNAFSIRLFPSERTRGAKAPAP